MIAVAHGSRDPRSAATMSDVVALIAATRPDVDVRLAFLDLSTPSVEQVVDAVVADGHTHAVVAPLLLGNAFHARIDLPGLLDTARTRHPRLQLTQADVLGPDPRLVTALHDRALEALACRPASAPHLAEGHSVRGTWLRHIARDTRHGVPLRTRTQPLERIGIAVAAVGSSSGAANGRTALVAQRLAAVTGWRTEICFATTEPGVTEAVSRLWSRGADHVLVVPWFLAPGLLTDRLADSAPELVHAEVIGAHPALADIVWDRYDATSASTLTLSA
ncbi:sirohydrochlorin chelatase [Nocardia sp. NPDC051463]|uniref:sirohydrochlorin chelatase n=1 Tax=Nocardia sp. NPDC051463 TaxID=3154845 RepID=UPI00344B4C58